MAAPIYENDEPVLNENGMPNVRLWFLNKSEWTIKDTWDVAGMRGSGSHNVVAEGAYVPEKFALHDNFPNPFNPSTVITYDLAVDGFVDLSIYNVVGKKIKTIVSQNETAGRKITAWYGRDDAGNTLSAGMYFYRLTAGGKVFTKKMVLMKQLKY